MKAVLRADGTYQAVTEEVPVRTADPHKRREERMPKTLEYTGDKGYKLADVLDKKVSMDEFVAQISEADLIAMFRGEGMCSPKVTAGTAAAFGGVNRVFEGSWNPGGDAARMGRQGFVWIAVRKRFLCQMELCWAVLLIRSLWVSCMK